VQEFRLFLLRRGLKPATIELYLKALKPLKEESPNDIKRHLDELLEVGRSPSYINSVSRACQLYGICKDIPELAALKCMPNHKKVLKSTMTDEQIERFISLPKPKTSTECVWERWNLLFAILAFTGMRAGECASLKWCDILLEQRKIAIRDSKTSSGIRFAPLPPPIWHLLSTYIQKFNLSHCVTSEAYIFGRDRPPRPGEWSQAFHIRLKMMGIVDPHLSTHSLRHSLICRLIKEQANLFTIMKLVGHSKPETTLAYTHLVTADVEKMMLLDPLNFNSLTFEQILDSFERVFDEMVKRYTHKVDITYTKSATGLTIEIKKPE